MKLSVSANWRLTFHSQARRTIVAASAAATTALLLSLAGIAGTAAGQSRGRNTGPGGWLQVTDSANHFSLSVPTGWTVQKDGRRVVVASADHSAFALIENFVPRSDETAEDHVDNLPKSESAILPGCKITEAYTLDAPAKSSGSAGAETGEQAIGMLTYLGQKGPGDGRFLCLVFPRGGLLFGMAAPHDRFTTERPTMLRILQSFQFNAPAPAPSGHGREIRPGVATASDELVDPLTNFHYVPFEDGVEHSFSIDVPQGWSKDGGTLRASILEARQTILCRSPHDEMAVMVGDSAIPQFTLPTRTLSLLNHPEGSTMTQVNNITSVVQHFMPAVEFNRWYLNTYMSRSADSVEIGEESDKADLGATMTANANKLVAPGNPGRYTTTVAQTAFTCRSKRNGRRMAGLLSTYTTRFIGDAQGDGNWTARPNLVVWATGDSRTEAREKAAKAVFWHVFKSFKVSEAWSAAEMKRQKNYVAMVTRATQAGIEARRKGAEESRTMSRSTVRSGDDRREKMMGEFRQKMAAKDDNTRKRMNYSLDQTDVTNGSQSWKVASGYSNYYRHEASGSIIGTNSPAHPGVGFTQLGER